MENWTDRPGRKLGLTWDDLVAWAIASGVDPSLPVHVDVETVRGGEGRVYAAVIEEHQIVLLACPLDA